MLAFAVFPRPFFSQTGPRSDLPPLEFLGFRAGTHLAEIAAHAKELGSTGLKCDRARRDQGITECRGALVDSLSGQPIELWFSAVDSAADILTLSGPVTAEQLMAWRNRLESAFGLVGARVQGSQWMLQWVRNRQMLRLTWRVDQHEKVASVSLVDGPLLDDWGRRRTQRP